MTTRGQALADVSAWLDRDVSASADSLIRLAESMAARDVRLRAQETLTTLSATSDTVALPADFLSPITVSRPDASNVKVQVVSVAAFRAATYRNQTYAPAMVAFEGTNLLVVPAGSVATPTEIELAYFARMTAMTADDDTTPLLTNEYDLFFALLMHVAGLRFRDIETADRFGLMYQQKLEALKERENQGRNDGGAREIIRDLSAGA